MQSYIICTDKTKVFNKKTKLNQLVAWNLYRGIETAEDFLEHNALKITIIVTKSGTDALQRELHSTV